MFSSKQMHNFDYFICYHLESGWQVTRPNQGLSLGRGKSLGTRLPFYIYSVHLQSVTLPSCMAGTLTKLRYQRATTD